MDGEIDRPLLGNQVPSKEFASQIRGRQWQWALPRFSMTSLLAWRNLAHDRIRLLVASIGIVFAVVLMAVQLSLLVGFAYTAAGLIQHAEVDLWISARGTKNVDQAVEIPDRWRYRALEVQGVRSADDYITHFALLRRPDGGSESIILVGFDVDRGVGAPWDVVAGSIADLKQRDGIFVDELYRERLGITHLGQVIEINGQRARIIGFTKGIRTFIQSPYVFASFETARRLGGLSPNATKYILIKASAKAVLEDVRRDLATVLPAAKIFDTAEFARATQLYWLLSTGAGLNLVLSALLGLVIGVVITAQTLYASAIDHLPEYATLRAMGAPAGYLSRIIIKQALINSVLGYTIGISIALTLVSLLHEGEIALRLPLQLAAGLGALTVALCTLAGLTALRRVVSVSPTSVFR